MNSVGFTSRQLPSLRRVVIMSSQLSCNVFTVLAFLGQVPVSCKLVLWLKFVAMGIPRFMHRDMSDARYTMVVKRRNGKFFAKIALRSGRHSWMSGDDGQSRPANTPSTRLWRWMGRFRGGLHRGTARSTL